MNSSLSHPIARWDFEKANHPLASDGRVFPQGRPLGIGNLAVNCGFNAEHERALLALYFGETRPADARRLRLMRLASDLREAMWGFLQSALSDLNEDFAAYGRQHLERFLASPVSREFDTGQHEPH